MHREQHNKRRTADDCHLTNCSRSQNNRLHGSNCKHRLPMVHS